MRGFQGVWWVQEVTLRFGPLFAFVLYLTLGKMPPWVPGTVALVPGEQHILAPSCLTGAVTGVWEGDR